MNLTQTISDYLDGLANTRLALRAPSVFLPFAVFAALQCAFLFLLASFTAAPLAPFMVPVIERLGGEEALHYPMHLVRMPAMYQKVYLPLVATVGFALWSYAVWLMVDRHVVGRTRPRRPFARALPHVLLVGVVFVGVSTGIGAAMARVSSGMPDQLMLARGLVALGVLVTAAVQAFLIYTPVAMRLTDAPAWRAVRTSARYAARRFAPTVLVLATVLCAHIPLDLVLAQSHRVAFRFHPESVLHFLIGSVILEMFTAYLLFAATTELALPEEGGLR
jgi:hypothetical protein